MPAKPPYPPEFRTQMVELVRVGRTPADLSRVFGVSAQTISNWVAQQTIDSRESNSTRQVKFESEPTKP
jgi:transposase-like protein